MEKKKVFIVHGHDEKAIEDVAKFIESLGLLPIILRERPNAGRTIIKKFEEESSDAVFAVILYTPCDMGRERKRRKLHPRARQNVVLEHGYFIGKLGRSKVVPLYKEGVELPGDILGVVYTPMDASGKWKEILRKELEASGVITCESSEIKEYKKVHFDTPLRMPTTEEIIKGVESIINFDPAKPFNY